MSKVNRFILRFIYNILVHHILFFKQDWSKEGLPSFICSSCIERLRVSYDFRTVCLQSENTLQKYGGGPMSIAITPENVIENIVITTEGSSNAEYVHLKHFLDNEDELKNDDNISRDASPCMILYLIGVDYCKLMIIEFNFQHFCAVKILIYKN